MTYPSGLRVHYRVQFGQVTGIDVQEPGGTARKPKLMVPFVSDIRYTPRMLPRSWNWSNGDSASRSFDREGLMLHNEFADYGYDAAGRMSSATQNLMYATTSTVSDGTTTQVVTTLGTTPLNWRALYDSRGRITYFGRNGISNNYTYDANSNRLTSVEAAMSDIDLNGEFDDRDNTKMDNRTLNVDAASNRLLGQQYSTTIYKAGKLRTKAGSTITYTLDANGSMTSDGLRTFEYDEFGRMNKVRAFDAANGEAAVISYLTNAQGQRVFKSEPVADVTDPANATPVTDDFVSWLKRQFGWLYARAQVTTSLGTAYVYGDEQIPSWALLGEYDNGSASGAGRSEYIWLPLQDGSAIPIGMYRNGKFYAIHPDHLGTPRLMTDDTNTPVWQWPYSAFGAIKPTGVLRATTNPQVATTIQPMLLKATAPAAKLNLRYPGQRDDPETGTFYNMFRDAYDQSVGRYRQEDPIGLAGGWNRFGYARNNSLMFSDPLGLATLTLTGGGSAVVGGGGEGSAGIYFSNKPNDIGIVISGGAGTGANVGLSVQFGYVPGPLSNVPGKTKNYNASCAVGSFTWMTDPKTGDFAGGSIGPAGRLGASATDAQTGTWGLRDAFDWLFNRLGGIK